MAPSTVSAQVVKDTCNSGGFDVQSIEQVRSDVFRAALGSPVFDDSTEVYVRVYPDEREENLRAFLPVATDAGHPDCTLVDGDVVCLVMDIAPGRPLSQLLPVVFLPGLWQLYQEKYRDVYYQVGTQVGTLHSNTIDQSGQVLDEDDRKRALELTRLLEGRISDSKITAVRDLLERSSEYDSSYTLTFGDRSPHNIYFDGADVWQIDNMCKQKSVIYEHAGVIMGIRLMVRRLPYASTSIIRELEESYWDGYETSWGRPRPENDRLAVRYVYKNLRLIEHYNSGVSSLNSRLTKWVDPPIVCDEIARTVDSFDYE